MPDINFGDEFGSKTKNQMCGWNNSPQARTPVCWNRKAVQTLNSDSLVSHFSETIIVDPEGHSGTWSQTLFHCTEQINRRLSAGRSLTCLISQLSGVISPVTDTTYVTWACALHWPIRGTCTTTSATCRRTNHLPNTEILLCAMTLKS